MSADSMSCATTPRLEQALEREWLHDSDTAKFRHIELLTILRDQHAVALDGRPPPCGCCGVQREWRHLYRCYDCDLWLCSMCARRHFGERL